MNVSSLVRKFTVLLVFASLSLVVMNCSKKDDDGASQPSGDIVGSWKITNYYVKSGGSAEVDQLPTYAAIFPCFTQLIITFKTDGTVDGDIPQACQVPVQALVGDIEGSRYEAKGGQLTLIDSEDNVRVLTVNFSGSQMSLITSTTAGGSTSSSRIVLQKQ